MKAIKEQTISTARAIDISSIQRGSKMNFESETMCLEVKDFNLFYGEKQALHNINMDDC